MPSFPLLISTCLRRNDVLAPPTVHDVRAACYEFLGTALFLLFGLLGCQTAADAHAEEVPSSRDNLEVVEFCAKSFGLSLFVFVSMFFR
jgi:hypothetical protein